MERNEIISTYDLFFPKQRRIFLSFFPSIPKEAPGVAVVVGWYFGPRKKGNKLIKR